MLVGLIRCTGNHLIDFHNVKDGSVSSTKKLFNKSFVLLCFSEMAFDLGAAMLGLALGIWAYEQTQSVQQFTWVMLSSMLPAMICMPVAGVLADRCDRRWVIAGCDGAALLLVLVVAVLSYYQALTIEHLYLINVVGSIVGSLRNPSHMAAVSEIIPQDQLTRATGIVQTINGVLQIGAPVFTGFCMAAFGFVGVAGINLLLAVAGMVSIFAALTHVKHGAHSLPNKAEPTQPVVFWRQIHDSFAPIVLYFRQRVPMQLLFVYVLLEQGLVALVSVLIMPLVLAEHSSASLGLVMTSGAVGGLVGSLTLTAANIQNGLMRWVLIADLGLAVFVMLAGVTQVQWLWCLCAFSAFAFAGVSAGCSNALWIRNAPPEIRGSLFAALGAAHLMVMSLVLYLGGVLVEQVLEPLMMPGGALVHLLGDWLGVGKGRGVALLFMLAGMLVAFVSIYALVFSRLPNLNVAAYDEKNHHG